MPARSEDMHRHQISRRGLLGTFFTTAIALGRSRAAAAAGISLPMNLPETKYTFDDKVLDGWTTVTGQWALQEMAGAPTGTRALVQRATTNEFNVIVAPPGPFTDVDVTVKFYPIS